MNLRWPDVDLVNNFIVVRNLEGFKAKAGHERRVPVTGPALEVLQWLQSGIAEEVDGDGLVFVDNGGLPVKPDRVSKRFKFFARLAKLDECLHFPSLRHTTESWLVNEGRAAADHSSHPWACLNHGDGDLQPPFAGHDAGGGAAGV